MHAIDRCKFGSISSVDFPLIVIANVENNFNYNDWIHSTPQKNACACVENDILLKSTANVAAAVCNGNVRDFLFIQSSLNSTYDSFSIGI